LLAELDSIEDSLVFLKDREVHVLFVDIQLRDGKGIEILDKIDTTKYRIIFTTAHEEYALEAFKHKAFGYLLKPLDPNEFKEIMGRVIKDLSNELPGEKKIKVPLSDGHIWINTNTIIRCESESNYTKIYCLKNQHYTIARTLKHVEKNMIDSDDFIRIHQSHLVNSSFINSAEIRKNSIQIEDGTVLPVSRSKKQSLVDLFEN
jgi:two-component system LytT family response regulator